MRWHLSSNQPCVRHHKKSLNPNSRLSLSRLLKNDWLTRVRNMLKVRQRRLIFIRIVHRVTSHLSQQSWRLRNIRKKRLRMALNGSNCTNRLRKRRIARTLIPEILSSRRHKMIALSSQTSIAFVWSNQAPHHQRSAQREMDRPSLLRHVAQPKPLLLIREF